MNKKNSDFRALLATRDDKNVVQISQQQLTMEQHPGTGNTLVKVEYSDLNYKDAMALVGNRASILRKFPIIPGIDFAGEIIATSEPDLTVGDKVIATGFGLGEKFSGGYSEIAKVPGEFLLKLPAALTTKAAMQFGTAGFTAMLAVQTLADLVPPDAGEIAVTGASGGVGGFAIAFLKQLQYQVIAVSSKPEQQRLLDLGADAVITTAEISGAAKPLQSARWAGAIDNLGGLPLANILASCRNQGVVAACGLAADYNLATTVMPFILRGVKLMGIDSVYCPMRHRQNCWQQLAKAKDAIQLDTITKEAALAELPNLAELMLKNQSSGRVLVNIAATS